MTDIIPFGKYKGQPLEVLAADKSYSDWLVQQDWFKTRYQGMYTVVINNFAQPTETPEHNAIQALFLSDTFCLKFAHFISKLPANFPTFDEMDASAKEWVEELVAETTTDYRGNVGPRYTQQIAYSLENVSGVDRKFEHQGIDVTLDVTFSHMHWVANPYAYLTDSLQSFLEKQVGKFFHSKVYRVEIKPAVSDDYPAILRQILASKADVLFLQQYTGVGVTLEQFRQIFKQSGKRVVFQHEVEDCVLPAWVYDLIDLE